MKKILESHKLWLDGKNGKKANMSEANLSEEDPSKANLSWADLSRADLRGANLHWADLSRSDLRGADLRWANLSRADLSWANLRRVNLRRANLSEANLSGANLPLLVQNPDPDLIKKVAEAALSGNLKMDTWHSECGTAHCIAGWAVTLHPEGKKLEEKSSSYLAGRLLLGDEAAEHFFDDNETALEWLKTKL